MEKVLISVLGTKPTLFLFNLWVVRPKQLARCVVYHLLLASPDVSPSTINYKGGTCPFTTVVLQNSISDVYNVNGTLPTSGTCSNIM